MLRRPELFPALLAATLAVSSGIAWARPVVCAGGETLAPLMGAWASAARRADPRAEVSVDPAAALSADGMRALLAGRADCVSMVREPFPSELAAFRARFGHDPALIEVARGSFATRGGTHAIAIFVNAANPIRSLTLDQLRSALAGPARTWGALGATGAWGARPLRVYGMTPQRSSGDPPGVVNYLEQQVMAGAGFRADLHVEVDTPAEQALAAIVREVAADPDGLGYSGFGYALPGARAVAIAERAGAAPVDGAPASVADGAYPLARHVYVLADKPLDPRLAAFLAFVVSRRGQAMMGADREGFLPLTSPERRAAARMLR